MPATLLPDSSVSSDMPPQQYGTFAAPPTTEGDDLSPLIDPPRPRDRHDVRSSLKDGLLGIRTRYPLRLDPLATSEMDALLHTVKASLGSGILAMPDAFKNCGLFLGLLGTLVVGLLCTHGTYLIVKSSQELCYLYGRSSLGYTDTVELAVQNSHLPGLRRYSTCIRRIASIILFLTYIGVNTISVLLIASTMQQICQHHLQIDWSIRWFMLLLLVPLLPIAMVHQMKYLVPFSAVANFLFLVGLSLTFYYVMQDLPPVTSRDAVSGDLSSFPLFFSTVLCGMENIGVILPVENSMRNPRKMRSFPGVLNNAMIFITVLFAAVGFVGYLKFGDDVQGSIILNMGNDLYPCLKGAFSILNFSLLCSVAISFTTILYRIKNINRAHNNCNWLAEVVKVCVALSVLLSYGLSLTACFGVAWKAVEPLTSKDWRTTAFYSVRVLLVVATVLFGIAVPQLAPVISLVGSVGFTTLGLLLPALTETLVFWRHGLGWGRWRLYKNTLLAVVAVCALVTGSGIALRDISNNYT